jgi:hypothetical protein
MLSIALTLLYFTIAVNPENQMLCYRTLLF